MSAAVLRLLRRRAAATSPDGELLRAYLDRRDEDAFRGLVERHGPAVLGVCRRRLGDPHAADDAFQATFLALARHAHTVRRPEALGSWLYGVAVRVCARAVAARARRRDVEAQVAPRPPATDPAEDLSARELFAVLDAELYRLPERYRTPLWRVYWQGQTHADAGRELGLSVGALHGRLERGRQRLAARLRARGVTPGTDLTALLVAPLAVAAMPAELLARTTSLAATPWSRSLPASLLWLAAAAVPSKLLPVAALAALLVGVGVAGFMASRERERPEDFLATKTPPVAHAPGSPENPELTDPLPAGAVTRFGTARFRHGTAISMMTVSADGRVAVAGSGNHYLGTNRAYDLTTGKVLYQLPGFVMDVEAVALSPDGRTLATKDRNAAIVLRDAATGQDKRKVELPVPNPRTITNWLAFSHDGKAVAASTDGKTVILVDVENGTLGRTLGPVNTVFAAAFSPDGKFFATGGYDSERSNYYARLWEVATGKDVRQFRGHKGGIRSLAFSPDGATLATGGDDAQARLFDVATGEVKWTAPKDGYRVRSVAFAPDGKTLAVAADSVRLYHPETGQEKRTIEQTASALHFDSESKVLTGAVAGAIHRWDAATGQLLTPSGSDSAIDQVMVTPDGRRVLTRDQSGAVHVWDAATGAHVRRIGVTRQWEVTLSRDGTRLAWGETDPSIRFKDPGTGGTRDGTRVRIYKLTADRLLDPWPGYQGSAWGIAFAPDGRTLLTIDHQAGSARVWDATTGKELRSFTLVKDGEQSSYPVSGTELSPDGKTLAVAYNASMRGGFGPIGVQVRLWDVETGRPLRELAGHANRVEGLAFSPDSKLLATSGPAFGGGPGAGRGFGGSPMAPDRVYVWDVATGQRVPALPDGLKVPGVTAAFSPDGRTIAVAAADGTIHVCEVATWGVRTEFRGHRDRVTALAFGPDGRLFSGSLDTTVLAWDTGSRRE